MAKTLTEIDEIQKYLEGVLNRAGHHAQNVQEVILTLVGALIWKKGDTPIKAMYSEDDYKNVMWAYINNKKYAFSYNHADKTIDMRQGSTQGITIKTFTNDTTPSEIMQFFRDL